MKNGIFTVSHDGKKYTVNFGVADGNPSCTCKDWISHHLPCKHFFAVFRFKENWTWNSLPREYLNSAYLSVDHDAIATYVSQSTLGNDVQADLKESELDRLYCPPTQQLLNLCDTPGKTLTKKRQSIQKLAKEIRITLESMKCLTYDATEEQYDALSGLHLGLQQLMSTFRENLPRKEGLLVRPEVQSRATAIYRKKRASRMLKLARKAPAGRKKLPASFRNRIGARANKHKKVYIEDKSIQDSQKISVHEGESSNAEIALSKVPPSVSQDSKQFSGVTSKRKQRCGECEGCKSANCGKCQYCRDMKVFGGQGKKKQCCIRRRCKVIGCKSSSFVSIGKQTSVEKEVNQEDQRDETVADKPPPYQTIQEYMKGAGRFLYPVSGDGSCLFRAFSHQLTGCENSHYEIRTLLTRFENLNSGIFEKRLTPITASTIREHICHLQGKSVWGTHVEIDAAATYFQIPVYYCQMLPSGQYKWHVVKPLDKAEKLSYPLLVETAITFRKLTHMEIFYHSMTHYDSIVSYATRQPSSDPLILENNGVHSFVSDIL